MILIQVPSSIDSSYFLLKVGKAAFDSTYNFSQAYMGYNYCGFNPTCLPRVWQDFILLYKTMFYLDIAQ